MSEKPRKTLLDPVESTTEHEQRIAATLAAGVLASMSPIGINAERTSNAVRVYREILDKLHNNYV